MIGVDVDDLNVAVMAPTLGTDLSYIAEIDPRIRVLDLNHALPADRNLPLTPDNDGVLATSEVLLIGYPVPGDVAARAPRLAWAHHSQAGVSNLRDSDLWTSSAILTTSRGAVAATAIAEYVIAAAGHFARGLYDGVLQKRAGTFAPEDYSMATLSGTTMGIIGLGGIGQEVARLSHALGMRVIATRRSATRPVEDVDGADVLLPAREILDLAAESDFLAICSQLTPETHRMIDARVFAAMKPSAVLINISRGEEVDEEALTAAVASARIRGAVLDVYDGELAGRPPRRELLERPEILLTPHIAGRGDARAGEPAKNLFVENLRRFLDGRALLNVVDRERGH